MSRVEPGAGAGGELAPATPPEGAAAPATRAEARRAEARRAETRPTEARPAEARPARGRVRGRRSRAARIGRVLWPVGWVLLALVTASFTYLSLVVGGR